MAWSRVGQLSAEHQSLSDVVMFAGTVADQDPALSNNIKVNTGTWSYRSYNTFAAKAFGLATPTCSMVRCNFALNHMNSISNIGTNGLPVVQVNVDGAILRVLWMNTQQIALRAGYASGLTDVRFPVAAVSDAALARTNTWMNIGLVASFAESGFVSFYIDSALVLNWVGDTRLFTISSVVPRSNVLGVYMLGGGYTIGSGTSNNGTWTNYAYTDDFYCDYSSGVEVDAPPPIRRFLIALPSGAGGTTEWTPSAGDNYAAVDDAAPDSETTYVKAGGADLVDTYAYSDITVPVDHVVRAVIPMAFIRKTEAVGMTVKLVADDGANTALGTAKDLATTYGYVFERMETAPDGAAWTENKVNACEYGIKSSGVFA